MKKFLCIALALISVVLCITSCNFYTNASGNLAGESEASPSVEKMMTALSQKQLSDAKELMHPQVAENSDVQLNQMSDYLEGREAVTIEQTDISVKMSNGTGGKARQEQLTYTVTLDNGEIISLVVSYLSDNEGAGFTSFQIVLGVK